MLERNSGGFCSFCCCYSFIFFICRCFSFCWCCIFILFPGNFAMSLALHPSFSDPRRSPPALSSTPTTFDCLFFFIYCECYGFEWTFFNHRRFFLPNIFGTFLSFLAQPAFIKVLLGAGSYFFESCRASYWSSKHRPSPSVCLIHSKSFTYGENFDKISSHTIQQPWKYKAAAKLISNQNISAYLNCSLKKCISRYNCN